LARFPQRLEALIYLFLAGRTFRRIVSTKTQGIAVDDDVDIFGEAYDQISALG